MAEPKEQLLIKLEYFDKVINALQKLKVIHSKSRYNKAPSLWKKVYDERQKMIKLKIEVSKKLEDLDKKECISEGERN